MICIVKSILLDRLCGSQLLPIASSEFQEVTLDDYSSYLCLPNSGAITLVESIGTWKEVKFVPSLAMCEIER